MKKLEQKTFFPKYLLLPFLAFLFFILLTPPAKAAPECRCYYTLFAEPHDSLSSCTSTCAIKEREAEERSMQRWKNDLTFSPECFQSALYYFCRVYYTYSGITNAEDCSSSCRTLTTGGTYSPLPGIFRDFSTPEPPQPGGCECHWELKLRATSPLGSGRAKTGETCDDCAARCSGLSTSGMLLGEGVNASFGKKSCRPDGYGVDYEDYVDYEEYSCVCSLQTTAIDEEDCDSTCGSRHDRYNPSDMEAADQCICRSQKVTSISNCGQCLPYCQRVEGRMLGTSSRVFSSCTDTGTGGLDCRCSIIMNNPNHYLCGGWCKNFTDHLLEFFGEPEDQSSRPPETEEEVFPTYTIRPPIGEVTGPELIGRIVKTALTIVGSLALAMFVYGGFVWLTSGGSPDRIKKGKDILMWAIIGLVVIFASYTLVDFLLRSFGA